jgi:TatD DNase family protein
LNLIDTHVHLYEESFQTDLAAVIKKAQSNGVQKMIMPNVDKESIEPMKQIALDYPGVCLPMIGLHPCYVKEDYKEQLAIIENELSQSRYVAVGEIGLDLYWDKTFFEQQKEAFLLQTKWAMSHNLPIAIHSRESTREAIELLKPLVCDKLKGVFHCFVGTADEAKEIIEMGFYLGIGGVCTFKNGGIDKVLPSIPLDKLVLETDGPYLAPVPFRGKRNESSYLTFITSKVAEIYGISAVEISEITTENANKLFSLN